MGLFSSLSSPKPSNYQKLHAKWSKRHATLKEKLLTKHKDSLDWLAHNLPAKEHIAAGSLSGLLLLAPPAFNNLPATATGGAQQEKPIALSPQSVLLNDLSGVVPHDVGVLDPQEEQKITTILSSHLGTGVTAEMNGIRLNRNYGLIGAEQHLMRYPGDTISSHFDNNEDASHFAKSGMAPGRGAWGYFVPSVSEMTQQDANREKYYIAVQTFMTPGYSEHVREYSEFFKFRKVLVVNPQNGKAMVVVIGDAGPAVWTGKQLGGSPEVMSYLERFDGAQRGPVLYFFINDPGDKISLGPVNL